MELLTNLEQKDETANVAPVIYTAYGWVAGVFQPGKKQKNKKLQGMLLTQDGQEIPAIIDWYVLRRIKKQMQQEFCLAEFLQSVHQWKVYPRTQPLRFDIVKIRAQPYEEQKQVKNSHPLELDKFRVVGEIRYIAKGKIVMRIERNEQVPNRSNNHHPVYLELTGSIPTGEVGQIWELQVHRCGTKLRIEQAKVYQPSDKEIRLFNLLNSQKMTSQTSQSDALALDLNQKPSKVSTLVAKHSLSAGQRDLQQEETPTCAKTRRRLTL